MAQPLTAQPGVEREAQFNRWLIMVNGDALGYGRMGPGRPAELYVRVADLRRAVDGEARTTRLRVQGNALIATAEGGCAKCRLRVTRPVRVTDAVRQIDGELYLPLRDLVRALEGRLVVDVARSRYAIHAGKCDWCILEPST